MTGHLSLKGILAFRDITFRNPGYFVILFKASFHDFEGKKNWKIVLKNFLDFFSSLICTFLFVYSDSHLMNAKIPLLDMTITRIIDLESEYNRWSTS